MSSEPSSRLGDYQLLSMLGKGGFMTVYKGQDIHTQQFCAVKVLCETATDREVQHFTTDISTLQTLSHPFIAGFIKTMDVGNQRVAVTEYAEGGSLLSALKESGPVNEGEAKRLFSQLLSVVSYLHEEKKVIHRDLKLENVLLDANRNIKLIDFGFADHFDNDDCKFTLHIGSPAYICPEIAQGLPYNTLADVWSMGVILYALVCGEFPFEGSTVQLQLQKIVLSEPAYPIGLGHDLVDLLSGLLTKDASRRMTLAEIREHPWVASANPVFVERPIEIHAKVMAEKGETDMATLFDEITKQVGDALSGGNVAVKAAKAAIPILPRRPKLKPRFMPIQARKNCENCQRLGNEHSVSDFRKKTSILSAKQYRRSFHAIIQNIL